MRAAVTLAPNEMSVRSVDEPVPGPNGRDRAPGARRRVRVGHPLLLGSPRHHSQRVFALPAYSGPRVCGDGGIGRRATPPVKIEIGARVAVWPLAVVRPLLSVSCRSAERLRRFRAHRHPQGRRLWRTSCVCRSTRRSQWATFRPRSERFVEPMAVAVHGVARGAVSRRAGGRTRRRPDRPGGEPGRTGPRGAGAARRAHRFAPAARPRSRRGTRARRRRLRTSSPAFSSGRAGRALRW